MKNQIKYVSQRCPFDEFFHQIMLDCMVYVPTNSLVYYLWAEPLSDLELMLDSLNYNSPNIFLFIPSNLSDNNFIIGQTSASYGVQQVINVATKYPQTNFVLISDIAELNREGTLVNNLKYVELNLLTIEKSRFQPLLPVIEKNFDSNQHFLTLNNRAAPSRIALISYLLGNNLEQYGVITVSQMITNQVNQFDDYLDIINWHFNLTHTSTIKPKLELGFQKLKKYKYIGDQTDNFQRVNISADNFENYIKPLYLNSFVEIVTETYYEEPSLLLTEKTLQCILGCNFPIIIGSYGSIDYMEKLGFDVFHDVIDHSYDKIISPVDRLFAAIDLNYRILSDSKWAKDAWIRCQGRFLKNVEFSKKNMYTVTYNRVIDQFKASCISK